MKRISLAFLLLFSVSAQADYTAGVNYYDNQQFSQAFAEFKPLADSGHARSQYYVSHMYMNGYGIARDDKKGLEYLKKAADQGDEKALSTMAYMYSEGKVFPQDKKKAVALYEKAIEGNDDDALMNLGVMYYLGDGVKKDNEKAISYLSRVRLATKPVVGRYLGDIYLDSGKPEYKKKAKNIYLVAASYGDLGAYHSLGYMISSAKEETKDWEEAIGYYRYAASQGYAPSQYAMGTIYANGDGGERDIIKAYAWFSLAANQGLTMAVQAQQMLEKNMTLTELERARHEMIELQRSVVGKVESPVKEIQKKIQEASEQDNLRKMRARSRRRRGTIVLKKDSQKTETEE